MTTRARTEEALCEEVEEVKSVGSVDDSTEDNALQEYGHATSAVHSLRVRNLLSEVRSCASAKAGGAYLTCRLTIYLPG